MYECKDNKQYKNTLDLKKSTHLKHTWNTLENAKILDKSLGCFGRPPNPIIFFRLRDHY